MKWTTALDANGKFDFVVAADRLPACYVTEQGHTTLRSAPSALSAALGPVVAARHGAWVGWRGTADDVASALWESMWLHPLPLSPAEVAEHRDGQCGATIAPLFHGGIVSPTFNHRWRAAYREVNQRYARAVADLAAPGGLAWIHDYTLLLVPEMLRQLRPDLLVGFFLDSPFPEPDLFMRMPLRAEIMRGMLGADLIGFQRPSAVRHFLTASQLLGHATHGSDIASSDRWVRTGTFPASIDVEQVQKLTDNPAVQKRAAQIRQELQHPGSLLLAVDRLDHAKGIGPRLAALAHLLDTGMLNPRDVCLVQITKPSRHHTPETNALPTRITEQIAAINARHSNGRGHVIHHVDRILDRTELVAHLVAADVMLSTPLSEGMSLAAKEYVAAHSDGSGTLVLSEFTTASIELPQAFLADPNDPEATSRTLMAALTTPPDRLRDHMIDMNRQVTANPVEKWAGEFLAAIGACIADPGHARPTVHGIT